MIRVVKNTYLVHKLPLPHLTNRTMYKFSYHSRNSRFTAGRVSRFTAFFYGIVYAGWFWLHEYGHRALAYGVQQARIKGDMAKVIDSTSRIFKWDLIPMAVLSERPTPHGCSKFKSKISWFSRVCRGTSHYVKIMIWVYLGWAINL